MDEPRVTAYGAARRGRPGRGEDGREEVDDVRWEGLFEDMAAELAAAEAAEMAAEVADRSRREVARLRFVDRLRASAGQSILAELGAAGRVRGRLVENGPDWALLADGPVQVLLALAAVECVGGLGRRATDPGSEGEVAARLDLRHVLRGLVRARAAVVVVLRSGRRLDGTLDRVGRDFVELACHPIGEPRRAPAVQGALVVPLSALAVVRPAAAEGLHGADSLD